MKTEIDTRPRHITILISPAKEEFYEAYGPMTKDREKATLFFTNDLTLREPQRFGNSGTEFWGSERDAAAKARREYRGWTFRHEPQTPPDIAERLEYLRGEIDAERISYGEIHELQTLVPYIEPGDVQLLEWAGVPETV